MKKLLSLFLFFLPLIGLHAQTDVVESIPSYAPTAEENALLWQITGNDLTDTSYLFGTIHMIGKDDYFMTDATKKAIKGAELVTFEINMEEMSGIAAQFSLLTKAFMSDNLSLSDLLTEEEYALVKKHFSDKGMPLFLFERIKPMFLTVLADIDMSPTAMSSGEIVSYEMEIMKMAKAKGKEMGGLETAEYQMSMFDSIPYKAQAQMLIESIKAGGDSSDQFDQMVELYKNQDLQGMGAMISEDEEGIGEYEDLLLVQRNKNWIPVMGEMMRGQPTFFAVGAGHLGGEMGVVALLRMEGYEMTPIK